MINSAALDLIKQFEGFRPAAYKCPAGIWTIGYGTTAAAGVGIAPTQGMVISEDEAAFYLKKGVEKFAEQITSAITAPVNGNEFGAFVSLAYNIGPAAFLKSSALRLFNAGDKKGAANAFLLWNKAGGKTLKGLVRRREAERALFLTPPDGTVAEATAKPTRTSPSQSTTVQASAVQMVAGGGAALSSLGALDGTAQIVALVFAGVIVLAAAWVMRERLRRWAAGDR